MKQNPECNSTSVKNLNIPVWNKNNALVYKFTKNLKIVSHLNCWMESNCLRIFSTIQTSNVKIATITRLEAYLGETINLVCQVNHNQDNQLDHT